MQRKMNRRNKVMGAVAAILLAIVAGADAWQSPKARDIAVSTNGFNYPAMGTDVQSALAWFDANMLTTAGGLVDSTTLNTRLSTTSTQSFGEVWIPASPTSAVVRLGHFMGFRSGLTNGGTFHVTNSTTYVRFLTQTNDFNVLSWYSGGTTSKFTPLVAGYYFLNAQVMANAVTCRVQIVSQDTNDLIYVGTTASTNDFVSGGGVVYANGTSTNSYWVEGLCVGSSLSGAMSRVVFSGHYLGGI